METWFRLTKQDSLSDALLNDNPEKYRYKPYLMYDEGVLFLQTTKKDRDAQDIALSLSEQGRIIYAVQKNGSLTKLDFMKILYTINSFI